MKVNIPANAIGIYFEFKKFKGKIWVWPVISDRKERYQWAVYGQNGEEATREKAISAARSYVMGESSKPNEGENPSE